MYSRPQTRTITIMIFIIYLVKMTVLEYIANLHKNSKCLNVKRLLIELQLFAISVITVLNDVNH